MHEVSGRFLKKAPQKLFCSQTVLEETPMPSGQKFFAELFYKKATAYFLMEF